MNDVETMPAGTAVLLRKVADWLRSEHVGMISRHTDASEKAAQAVGWRRDAELERMANIEATANAVEEHIGSIEALLDRTPHAPPQQEVVP